MIRFFYLDVQKLNDDKIYGKIFEQTSEYRRNKINRIRFRKDKNLSLGAGFLLDCFLKEYGLCERDMKYGMKNNGKPYFLNKPEIYFNISHSDTKAIAVFSDSEIGCDIEKIDNINLNIAKRFFYKSEYEEISSKCDISERNLTFFRLWTLKESFMKITGYGMRLPLDKFSVYLNDEIKVECSLIDGDFYFDEYDDISGFCTAICSGIKHQKPVPESMDRLL